MIRILTSLGFLLLFAESALANDKIAFNEGIREPNLESPLLAIEGRTDLTSPVTVKSPELRRIGQEQLQEFAKKFSYRVRPYTTATKMVAVFVDQHGDQQGIVISTSAYAYNSRNRFDALVCESAITGKEDQAPFTVVEQKCVIYPGDEKEDQDE